MNEQNKGGNNLAFKAGIWYVVSSIMVKMVSIITTPIFTRLLSTDEYGTIATFSSWYSLFFVVYSMNLYTSIGRAKIDYPNKLDDYIGSIELLSLGVSLAISAVIFAFRSFFSSVFELSEFGTVLLLMYLISGPTINFVQSGYRYKYKYKQNIAIAWYTTLSTVLLSLALIYCLNRDKAELRMIGITVPTLVLAIIFWFQSIKDKHLKINLEYWKYGLSISGPMILHAISLNILAQADRIVISKYWGATPVAYYSLTRNYAILILVITDAINQAWQPWFHDSLYAEKRDEIKENTKKLVTFVCYVGLACVAIGPEAIYILGGTEYAQAVSCLPPMVLGVICQCIYTHYINIELHYKQTKYASYGTLIAAGLNLILNIIFVPIYGYAAAAYTTFASYFVLLTLHCAITRKRLKVKLYDDKFMFSSMIITALVSFIIYITYDYNILRYILIAVGFGSFLFVFRSYIGTFAGNFINKLKH